MGSHVVLLILGQLNEILEILQINIIRTRPDGFFFLLDKIRIQ